MFLRRITLQEEGGKKGKVKIPEKSMFHGKEERDNLGRSWMDPPKEQRSEVEQAYLPKRWIHTWSGHTKGVNAIRWATSCISSKICSHIKDEGNVLCQSVGLWTDSTINLNSRSNSSVP